MSGKYNIIVIASVIEYRFALYDNILLIRSTHLPADVYCNMLVNIHVVSTTGWIAVQRDVLIDFNLEEYSLNITTDSTLGSDDKVSVWFYTSQETLAGYLNLYFSSTPQYLISRCNSDYTNFPTNLPSDKDKVWRVTLTKISGIRLVVHCNEEEVVNTLISGSTCDNSDWSIYRYWSREVAKILFSSWDTASDYYQPQPGNLNSVF